MKHGKNPTVRQKKFIKYLRLNPENWLVCKDNITEFVIENRINGHLKTWKKIFDYGR